MTNHLKPRQKMLLRQYFAKTLILLGFQHPKNTNFSPFLPHFVLILEALMLFHITKNAETLIFPAF